MVSVLFALVACGGSPFDVSGTVNGQKFTAVAAYFGGPAIVFSGSETSCQDLFWIDDVYSPNNHPNQDGADQTAFQITFNNGKIVEQKLAMVADDTSPIKANHLDLNGDDFTLTNPTEGSLNITEIIEDEFVSGDFDFTFEDGSIKGSFEQVPWCMNILP